MLLNRLPKLRFSVKSILILVLGIAIGYSLNVETLRILTASNPYSPSMPIYRIDPPDVVSVEVVGLKTPAKKECSGQFLVAPDGRVNLGTIGNIYIAGMTLDEACAAIEKAAAPTVDSPRAVVNLLAMNSKTYYVITQDPAGDTVASFPISGNETVLDAIAQIGGVNASAGAQISVSRPPAAGVGKGSTFRVDWEKLVRGDDNATNYRLIPGDRVTISYVPALATK